LDSESLRSQNKPVVFDQDRELGTPSSPSRTSLKSLPDAAGSRAPASEQEVLRIESLFANGQLSEAEEGLLDLIREFPDVLEYRALLGSLYKQQDFYNKAVAQFEVALDLDPSNLVIRSELAETLAIIGDFESASLHFGQVLGQEPGSRDGILGMMTVLEMTDGFEAAQAFIEDHFQRHPEKPGVVALYGRSLLEQGRPDEAFAIVQVLVEEHPRDAASHRVYAEVELARGNLQEAANAALEAYRLYSRQTDKDDAASLYSEIRIRQDRWDLYEDFVRARLNEKPNDLALRSQLEMILQRRGNF